MDWTDMLTLLVKGIHGTVPILQESEYQSILAILAIIGIAETIEFDLSAWHGGILGIEISAMMFVLPAILFSFPDIVVRSLCLILMALILFVSGWYEPSRF